MIFIRQISNFRSVFLVLTKTDLLYSVQGKSNIYKKICHRKRYSAAAAYFYQRRRSGTVVAKKMEQPEKVLYKLSISSVSVLYLKGYKSRHVGPFLALF